MTEPAGVKPPSELKINVALLLCGLFCTGLLAAVYHFWTYSVPMTNGDYEYASESFLGYRGDAMYDAALVAYEREDYRRAVYCLNAVGETVHDADGKLLENKRDIAAEIKFLAGNILVKQKQFQQAIKAYEEALRINPDHRYAKYNLELLKKPPLGGDGKGGDGKGEGDGDGKSDPNDPSQGTKSGPPPKGI